LSKLQQQKSKQNDVGLRLCFQRRRRRDDGALGRGFILQRLCVIELCWMQPLMEASLKIGTRGSKLALWQANWVKSALKEKFPHQTIELVIIKTQGDKILDVPLAKVGGKGLFVKEIEQALLDRRVDLAVHSMKDMPAEIPEELCIGAIPRREIPSDVFISVKGLKFSDLEPGGVIGTSSLRRGAQLLAARADIVIRPLRGNLDTRLRKLETEAMDAIVVAAAGVRRLNLEDRITEYIDEDIMLPAVGQGALCIEIRENDPNVAEMISALEHNQTRVIVNGERAFLNRLEGGCQIPIAGYGKIENDRYVLTGLVADIDGSKVIKDSASGPVGSSEQIGVELAERLLEKGADKLLAKITSISNSR
jgi:hydroxymethylbilane synthase